MSVPIYDFAIANEELADEDTGAYYPCCGKSICRGCIHSFCESGNNEKCAFCNTDRSNKTEEESNEEIMKRAEANDAASICMLAAHYQRGLGGFHQDQAKAIELFTKSAELGYSKAHCNLGNIYHEGGDLKKAKFYFEAAAMAGHDLARSNLGVIEFNSGNLDRATKHWTIGASVGHHEAMNFLLDAFKEGYFSRDAIDSTLTAYNNSCVEMRSEARDCYMRRFY
jgi:TPR repeat protein